MGLWISADGVESEMSDKKLNEIKHTIGLGIAAIYFLMISLRYIDHPTGVASTIVSIAFLLATISVTLNDNNG